MNGKTVQCLCHTSYNTVSKAFTFAEVLITLGIIGVVAAMTLPALIQDKQNKELQVAFKKLYSEMNQASQKFMNDEGISVSQACNSDWWGTFSKYLTYFKGVKKVNSWYHSSTDEDGNHIRAPYDLRALKGADKVMSICDDTGFYTDVAGRFYSFNNPSRNDSINGPVVCVDINGYKRPNRYGQDFFLFMFTVDGLVIPMGQEHRNNEASGLNFTGGNFFVSGENYCKATSSIYNQYACSSYALSDTHPSKAGKTYWKDFLKEAR